MPNPNTLGGPNKSDKPWMYQLVFKLWPGHVSISDSTQCMEVAVNTQNGVRWSQRGPLLRCHLALWPDFRSVGVHCVNVIMFGVFATFINHRLTYASSKYRSPGTVSVFVSDRDGGRVCMSEHLCIYWMYGGVFVCPMRPVVAAFLIKLQFFFYMSFMPNSHPNSHFTVDSQLMRTALRTVGLDKRRTWLGAEQTTQLELSACFPWAAGVFV